MSWSNEMERALLEAVFQNVVTNALTLVSAGALTNLHIALATGDPGEVGATPASECAYTGYARQPLARSAANWPSDQAGDGRWRVRNGVIVPVPTNTGVAAVALTHWFVASASTGGVMIIRGTLRDAGGNPQTFSLSGSGGTGSFAVNALSTLQE